MDVARLKRQRDIVTRLIQEARDIAREERQIARALPFSDVERKAHVILSVKLDSSADDWEAYLLSLKDPRR